MLTQPAECFRIDGGVLFISLGEVRQVVCDDLLVVARAAGELIQTDRRELNNRISIHK